MKIFGNSGLCEPVGVQIPHRVGDHDPLVVNLAVEVNLDKVKTEILFVINFDLVATLSHRVH